MSEVADDELLNLVRNECQQAIGFDGQSGTLEKERTKALEYAKGVMNDVPALAGRSQATSSDIADAIRTALPDLIEILVSGDDVLAFNPVGEEDEEAAQQETDYLKHVLFQENDGFGTLYDAIDDALRVKTGIVKFWWEDQTEEFANEITGTAEEYQVAQAVGEVELKEVVTDDYGLQHYKFKVKARDEKGKICIQSVSPSDFAVGADTVRLRDATYCVMRSRPRVQDAIAQGYDADIIRDLPKGAHDSLTSGEERARDTVDENQLGVDGIGDLAFVELREHYLRLYEGDKYCCYRIVTGGEDAVLVHKEEVSCIPFAALTPYIVPHRFYGESLADLLIQNQQIKTALLRMMLDSGYFALNQRMEVAVDKANQYTIPDLMRNEPMMPVRSKTGDAVRPLQAGQLGFDVFGAMEFMSAIGENRTGIVRNAQGLNPDTLHKTATGAMELMAAAQKRLRFIARVFAETGLKDLYLGVHQLIRENPTKGKKVRLRNKWVEIDPTKFGERNDMTIEIGQGAAGREKDMVALKEIIALQAQVVQAQGGAGGPLVDQKNVYNALSRFAEKAGMRNPDLYFTRPPEGERQPQEPQPSADAIKAQADAKKAEADMALKKQIADQQYALDVEKLNRETALKQEQLDREYELKARQQTAEAQMRLMGVGGGSGGTVRFGGEVG